jgi:fluoride exporter
VTVYGLVFLGSGFGGLCRFVLSKFLSTLLPAFPLGTLLVNLVGMFFIGLFTVWFVDKNVIQTPYREMILMGFLGGLTTFSSFGNESFGLYQESKFIELFLYLSGNLILGMILLILGRKLGSI